MWSQLAAHKNTPVPTGSPPMPTSCRTRKQRFPGYFYRAKESDLSPTHRQSPQSPSEKQSQAEECSPSSPLTFSLSWPISLSRPPKPMTKRIRGIWSERHLTSTPQPSGRRWKSGAIKTEKAARRRGVPRAGNAGRARPSRDGVSALPHANG